MSRKYLHLDTESTGLTTQHGLIEIGFIIDIDGEVKEEHIFKMKPFPTDLIADEALEITGYTREEIMEFEDPIIVKDKILKIFDKYINKYDKTDKMKLFGFNLRVFDFPMLIAWFNKRGENYLGSYIDYKSKFDVLGFLENMRIMRLLPESNKTKLTEVCEEYEIELIDAHSSIADIRATRELAYKLGKLVKKNLRGDVF